VQRTARAGLVAQAQAARVAARKLEEEQHAQELAANEIRHERGAMADRLRDDYQIELSRLEHAPTDEERRRREEVDQEIAELRRKLNNIGNVNLDALAELEDLESRFAKLSSQFDDLSRAKDSLAQIINKINADSRRLFAETLDAVKGNFQQLFRKLFGGGQADIVLEEGVDILDSGIEIVARPPGKEPRSISLLSGGEKTLTCVALLLAIFQYRPSPFCVLDEVDAALDEANIERFIGVLQEFLAWTQFIVVTHSKKTMTCATTLYGVTMQESGVSKRVSVRFEDVSDNGEIRLSGDRPASDDGTQAA
jgi:chromosome segregation protein